MAGSESSAEDAFNSLLLSREENLNVKGVTLRTQNGRNGKSLMGDAGCLDLRRRQWRRVRALRQQNAALNYHLLRTAFHCGGISRSLAYVSEPRWITAQNRLVSAHPFKIRSLRLKPQSGRVLITLSLSFQSQKVRRLLFHTRTPFSGFRLEPPSPSQQILINLG